MAMRDKLALLLFIFVISTTTNNNKTVFAFSSIGERRRIIKVIQSTNNIVQSTKSLNGVTTLTPKTNTNLRERQSLFRLKYSNNNHNDGDDNVVISHTSYRQQQKQQQPGAQLLLDVMIPDTSSTLEISTLPNLQERDNKIIKTITQQQQDLLDEKNDIITNTIITKNKGKYSYLLQRIKGMAISATRNATRMTHASLGLGSLLFGMHHMLHICIHGWTCDISTRQIASMGLLHSLTAIAGVFRLDFHDKSNQARTAAMWPCAIGNIWLVLVNLSEYTLGSQAPLRLFANSIVGNCFQLFTLFNIGTNFYSLRQAWKAGNDPQQQKTGLWFNSPIKNVLAMFFAYQWTTLLLFSAHFWTGTTTLSVNPKLYNSLIIDPFPEFGRLFIHLQTNSAFAMNLGAFLVTLFKYKTIENKSQVYGIITSLNIFVTICFILPTAFQIGNGLALKQFMNLVFLKMI